MPALQARTDNETLYLEGIISVPSEDAEGGLYTPEKMALADLVRDGFLDVHHLMFSDGHPDAVIGEPEEVRVVRDGVWARFRLYNTQLARDIWNYVRDHPGVLGFSIAGGLLKNLFERTGQWLFDKEHRGSVAITRFPMHPATWAVAKKEGEPASLTALAATSRAEIASILATTARLLLEGRLSPTLPFDGWYRYFRAFSSDPVLCACLSSWAVEYFGRMAQAKSLIDTIKAVLIPDPEHDLAMQDATEEDMRAWLAMHPDDEHFTKDGKYKSLDDALMHLRYCKRLAPFQVAQILGYMRADPGRFFARIPKGWPVTPQVQAS